MSVDVIEVATTALANATAAVLSIELSRRIIAAALAIAAGEISEAVDDAKAPVTAIAATAALAAAGYAAATSLGYISCPEN